MWALGDGVDGLILGFVGFANLCHILLFQLGYLGVCLLVRAHPRVKNSMLSLTESRLERMRNMWL